jgi:transcriptional regulator with XRE-family HTH domain
VASSFGTALRSWRQVRGKSQLDLALDAGVSPRHVSFLETGRARPSREMILTLARTLDVPLRERNTLLGAAGFAPAFAERSLDEPELAPARRALDLILAHQEPWPAVVMDRRWEIVRTNGAAGRFFARFPAGPELPAASAGNVLRQMFHPAGLRRWVANWEEVAEALVQRVHREAIGGVPDAATRALLAEILEQPDVPERWRLPDLSRPLAPFVPVVFAAPGLRLAFFSAVTTLGTPQDVTLQELRIECFFPADAETAAAAGRLGGDAA